MGRAAGSAQTMESTTMAQQIRRKEPQDDSKAFAGVRAENPLRVYALKHLATNTWANTFVAANFNGQGQDLAKDAAGVERPGESPYNNWLTQDSKPIFRFEPKAIGFVITDPGDVRVRSILVENSRLEVKRNAKRIFNEPLHALPPGIVVRRRSASTLTDVSLEEEEHVAPDMGVMKMKSGIVFETTDRLEFLLFIEAAALAALAALNGSSPAQGISMGVLMYGNAFTSVEPTV